MTTRLLTAFWVLFRKFVVSAFAYIPRRPNPHVTRDIDIRLHPHFELPPVESF